MWRNLFWWLAFADLRKALETMMSELSDMEVTLGQINASTTEIGEDILDAIAKLGTSPSEADLVAFHTKMKTTAETLKGIAASYPPPVAPPESGEQG